MIRILGIDPGTRTAGLAVIELPNLLIDCVTIKRYGKETEREFFAKLFAKIEYLKKLHSPTVMAYEAAFSNPAYPAAGLALSRCIGIINAAAVEFGKSVYQVDQAQWKKDVTGRGDVDYRLIRICIEKQLQRSVLIADRVGSHYTYYPVAEATEHELAAMGVALSIGRRLETEMRIEGAMKGK
jgi:Holliday junction resolvasome RuvABC endonuclease subunit